MNILNLYYSSTGNTEKVALKISETLKQLGHEVATVKITGKDMELDILQYDFIFIGSGVYRQLPGKALVELVDELYLKYRKLGEIKPAAPRRPSKRVVVYGTYGGVHTGINEAVPAVKYMGQLFDHLGYTVVDEWYIVGEFIPEALREHSVSGRLGDIRGRPNDMDLREVAEKVKGILRI